MISNIQKDEKMTRQRHLSKENKEVSTPSVYKTGQNQVVVHSSREYKKFRIVEQNRAIDYDHVAHLYDAIEAKNLLSVNPILVTPDYEVIDGQHRLKAAEALGVPIYYIISQEVTVKDVASTNALTKHWSLQDYMSWYFKEKRPQYVLLQEFMITYPFLTLNSAMSLCYYGDSSELSRTFKTGRYVCNDLPFAHRVAKALLDFGVYYPFYKERIFVSTVANLMGNSDYDHRRMMSKLERLSTKLVKCPDMESYFERINEIYNYGNSVKNRVTLQKINSNDPKSRVEKKIVS